MMWIAMIFIVVGFVVGIIVGRTTKQSIEDLAVGCKMVSDSEGRVERVIFFMDEEEYKKDMDKNNGEYWGK